MVYYLPMWNFIPNQQKIEDFLRELQSGRGEK